MKSVLISIQPKWCELIANGKKTVEVRKSKPKLETPFKVYIYATKPRHYYKISKHLLTSDESLFLINGKVRMCDGFGVEYEDSEYKHLNCKVIGEFVCNRISVINAKNLHDYCQGCEAAFIDDLSPCDYSLEKIPGIGLSSYELSTYIRDKDGYEWRISDLVIYDKPKELSEFWKADKCPYASENGCTYKYHCFRSGQVKRCGETLTRPPQSWCYVEELG